MTPLEFQAMALALREAGAVKVRAGDLEVIWAGPFTPSKAHAEGFTRSRAEAPHANGQPNGQRLSAEDLRLREFRAELEGTGDV